MSISRTNRRWMAMAGALLSVAVAACGSDETPQPRTASSLAFQSAPTTAVAGVPLDAFQVKVVDDDGEIVDVPRTITLRLVRGDDPVDGFAAQAASVDGLATFEGIVLETVGADYAFVARSGDLPEVRSGTLTVAPAAPDSLELAGPEAATVGAAVTFQVVARDAYGNEAATFPEGAVVVESSSAITSEVADPAGATAEIAVSFLEPGPAWLTVSVGDRSATARVQVAQAGSIAAIDFFISELVTAGQGETGDIFVLDAWGNIATEFTGDVTFTSTEPTDELPEDVSFGPDDEGYVYFSGFRFTVAGERIVTATVGGVSESVTVRVLPADVAEIELTGADVPFVAGEPQDVAVVARDAFGNRVAWARGAVYVVTDDEVVLPVLTAFQEDGIASIPGGYALRLAGTQSIRAYYDFLRDEVLVDVSPAAPARVRANLKDTHHGQRHPIVAGKEERLFVRVTDEFENVVTDFEGELDLTGVGIDVEAKAIFDADSNGEVGVDVLAHTAPDAIVLIDDPSDLLPKLTVEFAVTGGEPASLIAMADRTTLAAFESGPLTLIARDADGNIAPGMDQNVSIRIGSTTHADHLPDLGHLDIRFRKEDAGTLVVPDVLGWVHEGSHTLDITTDEGLSTTLDFDVEPATLDVDAHWSSDVAGERTSLTLSLPLDIPVSSAARLRLTFDPDLDVSTAVVTPLSGFVAPTVEYGDDAIVVHVGGAGDFEFSTPGELLLVVDDMRNRTVAGPAGSVRVSLEMSYGARIGIGEGGARDLTEAPVDAMVLGPFADTTTTAADGRSLTVSGLRAGRAYAVAVLEGGEKAEGLDCTGPGWVEVHMNRLALELPPFDARQEILSCTTDAGSLTVNLEVEAEPVGIVSHMVAVDGQFMLSVEPWNPPSSDGRLFPMTWTNGEGAQVSGFFDARRGYVVPFPLDGLTTSSSNAFVAARAPVAVAVLHANAGSSLAHDQIALYDLESGDLSIVSTDAGGTPGNGSSLNPAISPSGRYVVFKTWATSLGGPGYVLFDRLNDDHTPVVLPDGLVPTDGFFALNFSPDETHFTVEGFNTMDASTSAFVVDVETLLPVLVAKSSTTLGARFISNDRVLIIDSQEGHLVRPDGSGAVSLSSLIDMGTCVATTATEDGFVLLWGVDSTFTRIESWAVHPETGETRLIHSSEDDGAGFLPIAASRHYLFGIQARGSDYRLGLLDARTLESHSVWGILGGNLKPARSTTVSSTPSDDLVVFESDNGMGSSDLWARRASGLAFRIGDGIRPVVDPTGTFVAYTNFIGLYLYGVDLTTGETFDLNVSDRVPGLGANIAGPIAVSPGGRWISFLTKAGKLWVYDSVADTFVERGAVPPPPEGPDQGQGYVPFRPNPATLVRVNPATMSEKPLGTQGGLDVVTFHQVALTPDGKVAAYLAETGEESDFGPGLRVFVEDVDGGAVERIDLHEGTLTPVESLATDKPISLSADGAWVSFVAANELYVASTEEGVARTVDLPFSGSALTYATLSGTGERVYVSKKEDKPDDHLYVIRNPFLTEPE